MLNQVPRTLLNIGTDASNSTSAAERDLEGSPPFYREGPDTKAGDGRGARSALITPHSHSKSSRANGGGGGSGGAGRGTEFFGGGGVGVDEDGAPPPLPSSTRGRGARGAGERGSKGEGGAPVTPRGGRRRSAAFTNESIANQALNDFGDGAVS